MLEIPYALSNFEFDDIKDCNSEKNMLDSLHTIYRGDTNVLRGKYGSLRGKLDDMRMQEAKNVAQYFSRIKEFVNVIKGYIGKIDDETISSKVLRTLFPIYAIRFFAIQELRCIPSSNLTLEGLVGRLNTIELSNFDNFKFDDVEFAFKVKFPLKEPNEKKKKKKVKYISSDSDIDEEDVE